MSKSIFYRFLYPSLKLTAKAPEDRLNPQKETSIPAIHFQVRTVSFREGRIYKKHLRKEHDDAIDSLSLCSFSGFVGSGFLFVGQGGQRLIIITLQKVRPKSALKSARCELKMSRQLSSKQLTLIFVGLLTC